MSTNLTRASRELFARSPDERCESIPELWQRCQAKKDASVDRWEHPSNIRTSASDHLRLALGGDGSSLNLNAWSFGQLCKLAGVSADTVNKLSPQTASRVFEETLPRNGNKPLQIFAQNDTIRSIHGTQYTRLWDVDLVNIIREFATDFQPPQKGMNGATGLYCGEQDMFAFLIDPLGWVEIDGQSFAPGFFLWNSEVGRRSLGVETFWFQAVCQNHIVWDAVEVVSFTRKHTAKVGDGLSEIRRIIASLVEKRDARKDGFYQAIQKAMASATGDAEETLKLILKQGINRKVAKQALELAQQQGRFTIFSVVDALTRLSQSEQFAGDRIEADQKASQLLELV